MNTNHLLPVRLSMVACRPHFRYSFSRTDVARIRPLSVLALQMSRPLDYTFHCVMGISPRPLVYRPTATTAKQTTNPAHQARGKPWQAATQPWLQGALTSQTRTCKAPSCQLCQETEACTIQSFLSLFSSPAKRQVGESLASALAALDGPASQPCRPAVPTSLVSPLAAVDFRRGTREEQKLTSLGSSGHGLAGSETRTARSMRAAGLRAACNSQGRRQSVLFGKCVAVPSILD